MPAAPHIDAGREAVEPLSGKRGTSCPGLAPVAVEAALYPGDGPGLRSGTRWREPVAGRRSNRPNAAVRPFLPGLALACCLATGIAAAHAGEPLARGAGGGGGFVDATAALGLAGQPVRKAVGSPDPVEGGLALSDIDGDGRLELYVAYGRFETGRLYSFDGKTFVARAGNLGIRPRSIDAAGYFIDLDGDGWRDFVSAQSGGVELFRNGDGRRFAPASGISGLRSGTATHSMAAADYDRDGDLDLFFAHWGIPRNPLRAPANYLWRNDGKGRYSDVSRLLSAGPSGAGRARTHLNHSFTPTFADIDADGDPDLLVAGDFGTSQVLRNEDGAAFVETGKAVLTDENGMGAAVGDYDRDGDLDWFVTSIHDPEGKSEHSPTGNRLYRNADGAGRFEDATGQAGVRAGGWGWGACFADFDNDGHLDLFHTNGWGVGAEANEDREDRVTNTGFQTDPSRLFMSNGDGTFTERAAELGIDHTGQGRGVVCTDYDGDGRVDIFIANHGAAPTVYSNAMETGNRWLAVDLVGRHANPDAIGAKVAIRTASGTQTREVRLGTGYLSHGPPRLHFGLGRDRSVSGIEVHWPGPGKQVSRLANVGVDRLLAIRQPEPDGFLLSVVRGSGTGLHAAGAAVEVEAKTPGGHYRFSHWTSEGGGAFDDARSPRALFTMPGGPVTVFANFLPGPPLADPDVSVARRWMEVLLQAIRDDFARPTVHARNLFHLSAAMYDAWAARSKTAAPYRFGGNGTACPDAPPPAKGDTERVRETAVSHAAWRLIRHRFLRSPGAVHTRRNADSLLSALGHDPEDGGQAAAFGRCIADLYIAHGLADGANEANDYASIAYRPANPDLGPARPDDIVLVDPDRWQPLWLDRSIDQSGHLTANVAEFVTPEWGRVVPFALERRDLTVHRRDGAGWNVYHDPGPPPLSKGPLSGHYKWGFALVARWSSHLSPGDGVLMDIAPSGIGNIRTYPESFEDYPAFYDGNPHGPGHTVNPATGRPYEPQIVPRGDYARALAEFWADGPDSETPPGHWFVILNAVNDHGNFVRRLGGKGPVLGPLEWDVKAYFTLGGAMHDAAIASWGIKGWYDYVRPISALRYMAGKGQSSDPALPSWSPDGIPLAAGLIEIVGPGDPLAGKDGEHAGKIKLRTWRGPDHVKDPGTDAAGVGWILAETWWPYQRPTFVTPPFAGYVSGHSTYSRAAAEVLTALTGDPFFPGGMSGFRIPANDFLVFERGPSVGMTLQWATYRDAADQCSLSRIWGGIHPPADDIPGRLIGEKVGRKAFRFAASFFRTGPGQPDRSGTADR